MIVWNLVNLIRGDREIVVGDAAYLNYQPKGDSQTTLNTPISPGAAGINWQKGKMDYPALTIGIGPPPSPKSRVFFFPLAIDPSGFLK